MYIDLGLSSDKEVLDLGINTGTVDVGREADLILLDANPLSDIGNSKRIHGVMLRGSWYSSSELEKMLSAYL